MEKVKTKLQVKEVVFYISFIIYCILKNFNLHFITKEVGSYLYLLFAAIVLIYVRYIVSLPNSSKKEWVLRLMPIMVLLSRNMFMIVGLVALSFSVFSKYERITYNRIMKSIYATFVFFSIFIVAYSIISYSQYFLKFDRYLDFSISEDQQHVVSTVDISHYNKAHGLSFVLGDVYLGVLKREDHEIVALMGWDEPKVIWLSDTEIQLGEETYKINDQIPKYFWE